MIESGILYNAAQVLLEGVTSSTQTPIDAVSLLSAGERRMVLHTFNRTLLEAPSGPYEEQTIHGMLEYWAAATPAAPAVEFEVCLQPHAALWIMRGDGAGAKRRPQALLQGQVQHAF